MIMIPPSISFHSFSVLPTAHQVIISYILQSTLLVLIILRGLDKNSYNWYSSLCNAIIQSSRDKYCMDVYACKYCYLKVVICNVKLCLVDGTLAVTHASCED